MVEGHIHVLVHILHTHCTFIMGKHTIVCSYGQASSKDPYKLFEYRKSVVVAMLDIT